MVSATRTQPPLVTYRIGREFSKIRLCVPMPERFSINNKLKSRAGSGQRMYVNPDYLEQEQMLQENLQKLLGAFPWQTAPRDRYLIFYNPVFPLPRTKKQKTGDLHNPLKPFSDVLKKAGAIYDDDNTWQEVATKHQQAGDPSTFWMSVSIYRFPDADRYAPLDLEQMVDTALGIE